MTFTTMKQKKSENQLTFNSASKKKLKSNDFNDLKFTVFSKKSPKKEITF